MNYESKRNNSLVSKRHECYNGEGVNN